MPVIDRRVDRATWWHQFRWKSQIAVYGWYRRARGSRWTYPVIGSGSRFRVTKSIPGRCIRILGMEFWLTLPMVIERDPLPPDDIR